MLYPKKSNAMILILQKNPTISISKYIKSRENLLHHQNIKDVRFHSRRSEVVIVLQIH